MIGQSRRGSPRSTPTGRSRHGGEQGDGDQIDAESGAVIDVEEEKSEKDMKSEQKRERKQ